MKNIFIILALSFIATSIFAQPTVSDLAGIWKLTIKNSGGKRPSPPQYISFKSDSTFIWGVDSLGVDPVKGTLNGKWLLTSEGEIKIVVSDPGMKASYYRPIGKGKYKYDATQNGEIKERSQMLEMDIYMEKFSKSPNK
jgi:hypothetical protein